MFEFIRMVGSDAIFSNYDSKRPTFRKPKRIWHKCAKCRATNKIDITFVGNSDNPGHVRGHGILNVECGFCKEKMKVKYKL